MDRFGSMAVARRMRSQMPVDWRVYFCGRWGRGRGLEDGVYCEGRGFGVWRGITGGVWFLLIGWLRCGKLTLVILTASPAALAATLDAMVAAVVNVVEIYQVKLLDSLSRRASKMARALVDLASELQGLKSRGSTG